MKPLRLFIAINIPENIRSRLVQYTADLHSNSARIRPVPAENLHITLKYLGDTNQALLPDLLSSMENCASRHAGFDVSLGPSILLPLQQPRTVGISIKSSEEVQALFLDLDTTLAEAGLAQRDRRRYVPHITTARIEGQLSRQDYQMISAWSCGAMMLPAYEITLFESTLRPNGPVYTPLSSADLV